MTFAPLPPDRTNVAPRTSEGSKGVLLPLTGNQEIPFIQSACESCSKLVDHGKPCAQLGLRLPYGQKRHENVPETEKVDAQFLMKMQVALWNAAYTLNGVLSGTIYNLGFGTANNVAQEIVYEIVAASGNTLTLKGRDPRLIKSPLSLENPNFPGSAPNEMKPDDVTTEQWNTMKWGRLIPSGVFHSLYLGAAIEFQYPSILFDKTNPHIIKVNIPSGTPSDINNVTFSVQCSGLVTGAKEPYDKAFPASKYYCTLYYYALAPESWGNFQTPVETWFTKHSMTFTKAQLHAANGYPVLKDTGGNDTRILFPSMASVSVSYKLGQGVSIPLPVNDSHIIAGGTTLIDLTSLLSLADLTEVTVSYCPLARETDGFIIPFAKTCANDQIDYTGSYVHSNGRRCTNVDCAKFKAGNYAAGNCWKDAQADKFTLGDETGVLPQSNGANSEYLSRLWNRTSLVLEQGMPGFSHHRNFAYRRPAQGGPSLIELMGSYFSDVPVGFFATRKPVHLPKLGQRREYTVDGDKFHEIILGAYEARTYEQTESGIIDKDFCGHLEQYVIDWLDRYGYRNTALYAAEARFPKHGPSANSLYSYELQSNGMMKPKALSTVDNQVFSTGNFRSLTTEANTRIQCVI